VFIFTVGLVFLTHLLRLPLLHLQTTWHDITYEIHICAITAKHYLVNTKYNALEYFTKYVG
jgi:hypothetical protein